MELDVTYISKGVLGIYAGLQTTTLTGITVE
jgi:hypothetical protein